MKEFIRILSVLAVCVMLALLCGCETVNTGISSDTTADLNPDNSDSTAADETAMPENGTVTVNIKKWQKAVMTVKNGKLEGGTVYIGEHMLGPIAVEYKTENDKEYVSRVTINYANSSLIEYELNDRQEVIRKTEYLFYLGQPELSSEEKYEYTYGADGRAISALVSITPAKQYFEFEIKYYEHIYSYDGKGKRYISQKIERTEGLDVLTTAWYNEYGDRLKYEYFDDNKFYSTGDYSYEYKLDENSRVVYRITFLDGIKREEAFTEYDEKGNKTVETTNYTPDGTVIAEIKEYNECLLYDKSLLGTEPKTWKVSEYELAPEGGRVGISTGGYCFVFYTRITRDAYYDTDGNIIKEALYEPHPRVIYTLLKEEYDYSGSSEIYRTVYEYDENAEMIGQKHYKKNGTLIEE